MTRDEILNMPAGREMDALVAKLVTHETYTFHGEKPPYSTNIAAAWKVVEKMRPDFFATQVLLWDHVSNITVVLSPRKGHDDPTKDIVVRAPTAPLAICRAALLAVMQTT